MKGCLPLTKRTGKYLRLVEKGAFGPDRAFFYNLRRDLFTGTRASRSAFGFEQYRLYQAGSL